MLLYTILHCTALHCTDTVHNTTPQLTSLRCIYSTLHHTVTMLCIALYATPHIVFLLAALSHTVLLGVISYCTCLPFSQTSITLNTQEDTFDEQERDEAQSWLTTIEGTRSRRMRQDLYNGT